MAVGGGGGGGGGWRSKLNLTNNFTIVQLCIYSCMFYIV